MLRGNASVLFVRAAYKKQPDDANRPRKEFLLASLAISRVLYSSYMEKTIAIRLGVLSPIPSSRLPGRQSGNRFSCHFAMHDGRPYLPLLSVGFSMPTTVTSVAVRSYRTISPLPLTNIDIITRIGTAPCLQLPVIDKRVNSFQPRLARHLFGRFCTMLICEAVYFLLHFPLPHDT
jgi:hypothetical protein